MTDTSTPSTDNASQTGQTPPDEDDGIQQPPEDQRDDSPEVQEGDGDDPAVRKARREAAGLRKRLRETETERDQLRARIDTMISNTIRAAVEADGYPAELAELITDTESLLDDGGALGADRLSQAIASIAAKYNITRKGRPPAPNPQQGTHGPPQRSSAAEWKAAFAPRPS